MATPHRAHTPPCSRRGDQTRWWKALARYQVGFNFACHVTLLIRKIDPALRIPVGARQNMGERLSLPELWMMNLTADKERDFLDVKCLYPRALEKHERSRIALRWARSVCSARHVLASNLQAQHSASDADDSIRRRPDLLCHREHMKSVREAPR